MTDHADTIRRDRRVHAESQWLAVVRYDRRGHWYVESKLTDERRRVAFAEAVQVARNPGLTRHFGIPGGSRFDAAVMKP